MKGGKVFYEGKELRNAVKDSELRIDFIKGKADNPKVNAILLVKGGLKNTHYSSY